MEISISSSYSPPTLRHHIKKSILIRHKNSNQDLLINNNSQHSENCHIRKYFPKYYRCLVLEGPYQNALLSKVKRIKKLKRFTGSLNSTIMQNLLVNNRKEIEEVPQMYFNKLHQMQNLRIFLNLKRILVQELSDFDFKLVRRYIGNMRNLKSLKMNLTDKNFSWVKWLIQRINKTPTLLYRLEVLSLQAETNNHNFKELFQYKNFLSHLTGLHLTVRFDPTFCTISETCKNLTSLSINFQFTLYQKSQDFILFLVGVQNLVHLITLEFTWPRYMKNFWRHFKPQPSLRSLKLQLETSDLIREGLFAENVDLVGHWEEIKELKFLEFSHEHYNEDQEIVLMKLFITSVLKKINKLQSFNH